MTSTTVLYTYRGWQIRNIGVIGRSGALLPKPEFWKILFNKLKK